MIDIDELGLGQSVGIVVAVVGDLGGGVAVDGFFCAVAVFVVQVVGAREDGAALGVGDLLQTQRGVVQHAATGAVAVVDFGVEARSVVTVGDGRSCRRPSPQKK